MAPFQKSPLAARVKSFISWHRRLVAAILAAAAMGCALTALRPPAPDRVEVLAAAEDLPGGRRLSGADLTTIALRPDAVPDGALRPDADVTGRTLAGPMRAGEPLTDAAFAGEPLLQANELTATPVRIADAGIARLLQAGARIDILAARMRGDGLGEPARVVAPDVRVIAVPDPDESGAGSVPGQGALIVVAATPQEAAELAGAAVTSRLTVTLRSEAAHP